MRMTFCDPGRQCWTLGSPVVGSHSIAIDELPWLGDSSLQRASSAVKATRMHHLEKSHRGGLPHSRHGHGTSLGDAAAR